MPSLAEGRHRKRSTTHYRETWSECVPVTVASEQDGELDLVLRVDGLGCP